MNCYKDIALLIEVIVLVLIFCYKSRIFAPVTFLPLKTFYPISIKVFILHIESTVERFREYLVNILVNMFGYKLENFVKQGILHCKSNWYPKFYNHVILKTLDTFIWLWFVVSKLGVSKLFNRQILSLHCGWMNVNKSFIVLSPKISAKVTI